MNVIKLTILALFAITLGHLSLASDSYAFGHRRAHGCAAVAEAASCSGEVAEVGCHAAAEVGCAGAYAEYRGLFWRRQLRIERRMARRSARHAAYAAHSCAGVAVVATCCAPAATTCAGSQVYVPATVCPPGVDCTLPTQNQLQPPDPANIPPGPEAPAAP